jgi:hypothetical protein
MRAVSSRAGTSPPSRRALRASALDPALAQDTLAIALTDELPSTLVSILISTVASAGEQGEARQAGREDIESLSVVSEPEGPADTLNRSALA